MRFRNARDHYEAAVLPDLIKGYTSIQRISGLPFDPEKAARAELAGATRIGLPRQPRHWVRDRAEGPRRAGVTSTSAEGGCVHVVLDAHEPNPAKALGSPVKVSNRYSPPCDEALFALSAQTPEALRENYQALLKGRAPGEVVHMCGSGVTACHNILAMEVAGLPGSRLYVGSWSEWIRDPARPVATGEN